MASIEEQMQHIDCDREISKLRAQLIRWQMTFKHIHVNNGVNESCNKCGLDLRDDIHIRVETNILQEESHAE